MFEQLVGYLRNRDWDFEIVEAETIVTGFTITLADGNEQGFPLYIMFIEDAYEDRFARFAIVPFVEQPYTGYPESLYPSVGQINHDLPGLKFAFDADGDLELVLDVPESQLNQSRFDEILQSLVDYAGVYHKELSSIVEV